ncbi:cell division protein ZipA [Natronospira proteinivora]|uniref:Cell division protein ZipA n=1 Tax=Natronospira proteinivora TaxID=1807133 RepID=A0ABT1G7N0_9GAMM|nr:cell division protein ZipA [Natronospira proteinivora]MCP1726955.1 cell division protein ZipA [Natronospira proteinivora]
MPELRLALIVLGIVLVLAVYLYSRWQSGRLQGESSHSRRNSLSRRRPEFKDQDLPSIDPTAPDAGQRDEIEARPSAFSQPEPEAEPPADGEAAEELEPSAAETEWPGTGSDETAPPEQEASEEVDSEPAETDPVLPRVEHGGRRGGPREAAASALSGLKRFARRPGEAPAEPDAGPYTEPEEAPAATAETDDEAPSAEALANFDPESQKIIAMHVMARDEDGMAGERLRQVLETAGTRHGQYNIFHRSERDALGQPKLLLSVANMMEPGYFELETMDEEYFRGISLFAVLPGPLPGVKTFHEMLSLAQTVAEEVNGEVCDEARNPFSRQRATYVEEEITEFERLRRQARARGRGLRR